MSVSDSQLSKVERGLWTPRPALRAALADLLGLDVVQDFEKRRSEPSDAPAADMDVHQLRDGERAVPQNLPELPDARVKRGA